jgi:hypothetical protein
MINYEESIKKQASSYGININVHYTGTRTFQELNYEDDTPVVHSTRSQWR